MPRDSSREVRIERYDAGAWARTGDEIATEEPLQLLLDGRVPLRGSILAVSGRAGYELVQKSVAAGIPIMVAVGAPSTLAVATAQRFGLTLVGFLRGDRFNVYSRPDRIAHV